MEFTYVHLRQPTTVKIIAAVTEILRQSFSCPKKSPVGQTHYDEELVVPEVILQI